MRAPSRRLIYLLTLTAACLFAAASPARGRDGAVAVDKAPIAIERRSFDRRNPPANLPELDRNTPAITTYRFGCTATPRGKIVSRRRRGGEYRVACRIDSLTAQLDLNVTVWLPLRPRRRWEEHEEGHVVIVERVYDVADDIAREAAGRLVGRTVTGDGPTPAAAAEDALRRAAVRFTESYHESAHGWAGRVGDRYDLITAGSQNQSVSVEDAIRRAFEQEPAPDEVAGR